MVLIGLGTSEAWGQLEITDVFRYGSPDIDECNAHIKTLDGGYMVFGYSWNYGGPQPSAMLMKLGSDGDSLWTRNYSMHGSIFGKYLAEREDSTFVFVTTTVELINDTTFGDLNLTLLTLDKNGDSLGAITYGSASDEECNSAIFLDGYIYSVGFYRDSEGAARDFWMMKTTLDCDSVWSRHYGSNLDENCLRVKPLDFGRLALLGYTSSNNGGDDYFMLITTLDGDSLATYTYRDIDDSRCYSLEIIGETYYLLGRAIHSIPLNDNILLVAINQDLRFEWAKTIGVNPNGSSEGCYSSLKTTRSTLLLSGDFTIDCGILEIDSHGNILDSAYIEENSWWTLSALDEGNGKASFAGQVGTNHEGPKLSDFTLWKVDIPYNKVSQSAGIKEFRMSPQIFPNPANSSLSVVFPFSFFIEARLMLYDPRGRLVYDALMQYPQSSDYRSTSLDLSRIASSGVYILKLQSGPATFANKIVILK